jgi:hypothetical protein
MRLRFGKRWIPCAFLLVALASARGLIAQETIVAIRHAEKPAGGLGQLTCRGLNRALALPQVLIHRFGKPVAIYAPDPAIQVNDGSQNLYSYVRPLITIEPTAIFLGMPVNAQIGFTDIARLQGEVTAPAYANALVFVAWEHLKLNDFAVQMLRTYGGNPSSVPDWPNSDYDRIYIFKIAPEHGKPSLTFQVDHEGLNESLSDTCPAPVH